MGILFTLLYVFSAYIGLPVLFPALAPLHIEIVIAFLTLLCTVPVMADSGVLKIPQTYAIVGLCFAVGASMVFSGWMGGAPIALMDFLPNAFLFFFVLLNFRKKIHLQLLVLVLLFCAVATILQGFYALQVFDFRNVYLEWMKNSEGAWFARLRGLAFLNDPNDFAQFMVGLIPCMFIFWVKGRTFRNLVLVIIPVLVLFWGMYLTHSRGGMIAMMVVAAVAGRKKLGLGWSLLAGGVLFVGLSAAGFAGGREISMESGADRMDAWAAGLHMIESRPIFGVGFGQFKEHHQLTAHNTVVLCAAELGLFGLFSWMLLMVPTVRDALSGAGKRRISVAPEDRETVYSQQAEARGRSASRLVAGTTFARRAEAMEAPGMLRGAMATGPSSMAVPGAAFATRVPVTRPSRFDFLRADDDEDRLPVAEVQRLANITLVSLSGFLTAGWFLSRAYTMSVFLYAGITAVIYRMGRDLDIVPPPMPIVRAMRAAAIASVCGVTAVWLILRVNHLLPQ